MSKLKWRKKEFVLLGMVALVICLGVVNNKLNNNNSLSTNAEYLQYEQEEMTLHDGEVLVDSKSLKAADGDNTESETDGSSNAAVTIVVSKTGLEEEEPSESKKMEDATLVTSDSYDEFQGEGAYFEEARSSINMDRNEIMSMLTEVIETYGEKDAPEKNQANEQKLKIIDYMNKEKVVEDILRTKGFNKIFVLITDNSVNVTVNKQDISKSDVAKIVDVVIRETGRPLSQITIQTKI